MSLFDNVKDKYKDHQSKVAETKDARGQRLAFIQAEYMGGYADQKKANGLLYFYENQTVFSASLSKSHSFTLDNSNITDVAIEGKDEVNRRVTVTRLVATGIFAFALKKKDKVKDSFITIVLTDGQEAIFHVKDKSPMELRTKLAKALVKVKQGRLAAAAVSNEPAFSVADELAKLARLKQQGVLTQAEFDAKKAQLLMDKL